MYKNTVSDIAFLKDQERIRKISDEFCALPEEEQKGMKKRLIKEYQESTGETKGKALETLIMINSNFIWRVIHNYFGKKRIDFVKQNMPDLFGCACEGFAKGIANFDPSKENLFFVLGFIKRELTDYYNFITKRSNYDGANIQKIHKAQKQLEKRDLEESPESIAELTGLPLKTVYDTLNYLEVENSDIYIDALDFNEECTYMLGEDDRSNPESMVFKSEGEKVIRDSFECLDDVSKQILIMTFGLFGSAELKDGAIAKKLKLQTWQVKRKRNTALASLKNNEALKGYFEVNYEDPMDDDFVLEFVEEQDVSDLLDFLETDEGKEYLKKEKEKNKL